MADFVQSFEELIVRWSALGAAGVTVSVCFGPAAGKGVIWSVLASSGNDEFAQPFRAITFEHAITIAETESKARGWIA